jgi:histidinol-phosphate/aromatic aminotransferase/cobyric acid decarboxylase-like protein
MSKDLQQLPPALMALDTGSYVGKSILTDSSATRECHIRDHRIVVRNCDSFAGLEKRPYIRVVVRTESENNLLLEGLRELWK